MIDVTLLEADVGGRFHCTELAVSLVYHQRSKRSISEFGHHLFEGLVREVVVRSRPKPRRESLEEAFDAVSLLVANILDSELARTGGIVEPRGAGSHLGAERDIHSVRALKPYAFADISLYLRLLEA